MKGKALRRALKTSDAIRVGSDIPLITDSTELVTPEMAEELLKNNKANRPVNWKKVEEFSSVMKAGEWKLHSQGIILDENGGIITGQTRLWAIVYSDTSVYLRISKGNRRETAKLIDRGRPQSARDLASRDTLKKHSPTESSLARSICAMRGNLKPSTDELSFTIAENFPKASALLKETSGTKKTKAVLMILSVICDLSATVSEAKRISMYSQELADELSLALQPQTAEDCWGKGAAFSLALKQARSIVIGKVQK